MPLEAQVKKLGEVVNLEVEYLSNSDTQITWLRNGKEIVSDETYSIETTEGKTRLNISNLTKKQSGKYEVLVKESKSISKSSSSVNIASDDFSDLIPPKFIQIFTPQQVTANEVFILEAVVEAYPNVSFQWFLNSNPIVENENMHITSMNNCSVLMVDSADESTLGEFTCRAENVIGSITCTATVSDVEQPSEGYAPEFTVTPSPERVMDGEEIRLTCQVTGSPIPLVNWSHNKNMLKRGNDIVMVQNTKGLCQLIIKEAFPELGGEYECHAENKYGKSSCLATVLVEGTPNTNIYKHSEIFPQNTHKQGHSFLSQKV